jgi:hypothetical protein
MKAIIEEMRTVDATMKKIEHEDCKPHAITAHDRHTTATSIGHSGVASENWAQN